MPKADSVFDIVLSHDQRNAFQNIKEFIRSSKKQYMLAGCAGSGKSWLTSKIKEYAEEDLGLRVCVTAPTNEAVKVISDFTGDSLRKTIYSLLGYVLVEHDDVNTSLERKGTSSLENYDLVILDEASMLQDDIHSKLVNAIRRSDTKVIYVGDSYQLPPVKGGAISKPFLLKDISYLHEIKRVQENNPILELVSKMRSNIDDQLDDYPKVTKVGQNGSINFVNNYDIFMRSALELFASEEYRLNSNHVKCIAYTNECVNSMNSAIRKHIYGEQSANDFVIGEDLIADKPILLDVDKTVIVYDTCERIKVVKAKKEKHPKIDLFYWKLMVENSDGVRNYILVVDSSSIGIYNQILASYARSCREAVAKGRKRGAWKPYFDFKNTFSWVKYSYAMTVHRMQGSTIKNVFVHEPDMDRLRWNDRERRQLKYVAYTRASTNLTIFC